MAVMGVKKLATMVKLAFCLGHSPVKQEREVRL